MSDIPFRLLKDLYADAMEQILSPPVGIMLPDLVKVSEFMGGLRPNELSLLCAPTGSGKTQFLANISAQLIRQKVAHYVAPVETGDVDFVVRIFSALAQDDFNAGKAPQVKVLEEFNHKYKQTLTGASVYVSTHGNRVDISEMIKTLKLMHQKGCKVAMLDNLNFFLKVTSAQNERIEMDNAIHSFVEVAKKIPMHIILVVHPKKTDGGRVESEFDIKGSSTAVQEAANVILFNRPKPEDVESGRRRWSDRELVFKKLRKRGMNINIPIWLQFDRCRYNELK